MYSRLCFFVEINILPFFQKNWEKIGNLGEDKSEKADYNNFDFFSSFFDDLFVFYILPLVYLLVYSSLDTFFIEL
jgi:hypothetical protein